MSTCTYTVTEQMGCRLVKGSVPLRSIGSLAQGMPKDAVMSTHAARVLDVNLAIGLPKQLAALCADPSVRAAAYQRAKARSSGHPLSAAELHWLAFGFHGLSSLAIFQRLTGMQVCSPGSETATPLDPSDMADCRRLLEAVPSFGDRLNELEDLSPTWAGFVARWPELCTRMDAEHPEWREKGGSLRSTYDLMAELNGR